MEWRFGFSVVGTTCISFGYRVNETHLSLADTDRPDSTFRMKWHTNKWSLPTRHPVRIDLGCTVRQLAYPVPDMQHGPSALAGAVKRVAADMPKINKHRLRRLRRFVMRFCERNFKDCVFQKDENFDFEEWMQNQTTYTNARKDQLRKIYYENNDEVNRNMSRRAKKVKGFVKDEPYTPGYKFPRGIYSRSDEYKCQVGPFFAKVGDVLFNSKYFIKKVPINDRPAWLLDVFRDKPNVSCTDWSQFEATFKAEIQKIEMYFYSFLLKHNPNRSRILNMINKIQLGINKIVFNNFAFNVKAKRMSGEMNTSLGNGFFNMVTNFFLLEEAGNKYYDGRFEGDDGIFWYDSVPLTTHDYEELGGKIKIETPSNLSEASFCGMVFDPEVLDNVCDPIEALVSFGWSKAKYLFSSKRTKEELIRAKGLSYLYQYPGCPVIRSLGLYALRVTSHITNQQALSRMKKTSNLYERDLLNEIEQCLSPDVYNKSVHQLSRELVQRKYKLPISTQLYIERYLDSLNTLQTLDLSIEEYMIPDALDYSRRYVRPKLESQKLHSDFTYFCVPTAKKVKYYTAPNKVAYAY